MNETPAQRRNESRGIDWDIAASGVLVLLGLAICVHAWSFPGGTRGVPGPAFFPLVVGGLLIVLSVTLVATTRQAPPQTYWARPDHKPVLPRIGAILLLLVLYASVWNVVPFVVRTPILLLGVYRLLGESWGRTVLLATLLTTCLYVVFQGLLSVQL